MISKYRPTLTAQEIAYMIERCDADARDETAGLSVALGSKLKIFAMKMQLGIVSSAYVSAPKQSLTDKLGFDTPESKRLAAFEKHSKLPSLCTPEEIKLAQTYRYENNLMTPQEEADYENSK
jgi:hypothetical protein